MTAGGCPPTSAARRRPPRRPPRGPGPRRTSAGDATAGEVDTTAGVQRVEDPDDPRLADYAALTDAALRKRYEHQHGVLIAEGPAPVAALVSSPYPLRSVLVAEERLAAMADVIDHSRAPVYVVTRAVLEAV